MRQESALLRAGAMDAPWAGADNTERVSIGHDGIDAVLDGGLARGRLHELFAAETGQGAAASGFASMLAVRLGGSVVWLRENRDPKLHAAGLNELGLDPDRVLLVLPPDPLAILRAGLDAVRCSAAGVVVIELKGNPKPLDLTSTRRLTVAAEASGVTPLLLRVDAAPIPSAAQTRWAVRAAPSVPLEIEAPGHAALQLELLRQRGRPSGQQWLVEWNREQSCFRDLDGAAASGAVVPLASGRTVDPGRGAFRRTG